MQLYDDFTGPGLDKDKWQVADFPLGDGEVWQYAEPGARVRVAGGRLQLDVNRFTRGHSAVQILDNPKHLLLASRAWKTGSGPLRFGTTLAGSVNGDQHDYRDGFASFNVLDFASGMVFDITTNGHRVWAIYERLLIPGITTAEEAFTEVVDLKVSTTPMREHEIKVEYDRSADTVRFFVDGKLRLERKDVPVDVEQLTCGFGFTTLIPIAGGKSVSCKGQGGSLKLGAVYVPE